MEPDLESFVSDFMKSLQGDTAAIFAGAGLSATAGFVDWRELLRPVAQELDLDVDREGDLVALAQFHCNENGGNRHVLNQLLIEKFPVGATPTENHRILARLPIGTYWTTNYDQLIERALRDAGKIADVKRSVAQLATSVARRDAVVYKMHGDVEYPHEAVLIKDDYERYQRDKGAFINALAGDLVAKTFLFLGFSFSDPNLDYVLSRIRVTFQENQRRHYCIFKRPAKKCDEPEDTFAYRAARQKLAIADLKRFNIKALVIDEYAQIQEILQRIERLARRRTVFISGSAEDYGAWTRAGTEVFLRDLSGALVRQGFRVATGVGRGVGDAIISGAIEEIVSRRSSHIEDALIMRPFPRTGIEAADRDRLWEDYRQDIIPTAGIYLAFLGNKRVGGAVVPADGVRREFEIARDHGLSVVPVGASGFMAGELWRSLSESFDDYYPNATPELRGALMKLGAAVEEPSSLIRPILDALTLIAKE